MAELFKLNKVIVEHMELNDPLNSYQMLSVIGKGAYAKVLLVRKKTNGKLYALKVMKKKYIQAKKQQTRIILQKDVLIQAKHPFLIKMSSSFQNSHKLFLVLEYCPGGELFALLAKKKKFTQQQARFYSAQIVLALEYLHELNIIYRDLKPQNILIDADGYIKLADFGLSKKILTSDDRNAFSVCGTPQYLAPEIIKEQGHGQSVDWWCLGSLIFEMLLGIPPFYAKNRAQLYDKIKNSAPTFQKNWSKNVKNLLEGLLSKNPQQRQVFSKQIKNHPWFATVDWDKLLTRQIKAPFKPIIENENDTSNFDKRFTKCSVQSDACSQSQESAKTLEGFSFQASPKQQIQKQQDSSSESETQFCLKITQ